MPVSARRLITYRSVPRRSFSGVSIITARYLGNLGKTTSSRGRYSIESCHGTVCNLLRYLPTRLNLPIYSIV